MGYLGPCTGLRRWVRPRFGPSWRAAHLSTHVCARAIHARVCARNPILAHGQARAVSTILPGGVFQIAGQVHGDAFLRVVSFAKSYPECILTVTLGWSSDKDVRVRVSALKNMNCAPFPLW